MKSRGPSSPPDPGMRSSLPCPFITITDPPPRTEEDSGWRKLVGWIDFKAGPHRWAGWLNLHLFLIGRAAVQHEGPPRSAWTGRAVSDSAGICGARPEKQNVGTLMVKHECIPLRHHRCIELGSWFLSHTPSKLITTKNGSWSTSRKFGPV